MPDYRFIRIEHHDETHTHLPATLIAQQARFGLLSHRAGSRPRRARVRACRSSMTRRQFEAPPASASFENMPSDTRVAAIPRSRSLVRQSADEVAMRTLDDALFGKAPQLTNGAGIRPPNSRVAHEHATPFVAQYSALSSSPSADAAMDRYADGDDHAFGELYDALAPRLYSYGLRLTRNEERAEDLVQHTWEMMCRSRGAFVRGSRVMPWAISILRNRDRDARKRPKVEQLSSDGLHEVAKAAEQPDPSECVECKQLDQLVRQKLQVLPACQRDAFELFYYGGLGQSEIAEVLDATVAGIKSRIQRATGTLRGMFQGSDKMDDK
jgi:RNA polymerase sigma-70 factor, ECF subfamily